MYILYAAMHYHYTIRQDSRSAVRRLMHRRHHFTGCQLAWLHLLSQIHHCAVFSVLNNENGDSLPRQEAELG
jgi:hypothetical protein